MENYDIETAREIVMDWFQKKGKENYTSDDVADILDDFEESIDEITSDDGLKELEIYLKSRWKAGFNL